MDIESAREYCLSLPYATEDMAFGDGILLFRVCNKIFACMTLDGSDYFALKCDPDYAIELRDRHHEIQPAYHWNKRHWNQLPLPAKQPNTTLQYQNTHINTQLAQKQPKKQ